MALNADQSALAQIAEDINSKLKPDIVFSLERTLSGTSPLCPSPAHPPHKHSVDVFGDLHVRDGPGTGQFWTEFSHRASSLAACHAPPASLAGHWVYSYARGYPMEPLVLLGVLYEALAP